MNDKIKAISIIRARSGFGINNCFKAYQEANGDIEEALKILSRMSGKPVSSAHIVKEGIFGIFEDEKCLSVIQLGCETDFVAKSPLFVETAHSLAELYANNPEMMTDEFKKDFINTEYGLKIRPLGEVICIAFTCLFDKKDGPVFYFLHQSGINKVISIIQLDSGTKELGDELTSQVTFERPLCIAQEDINEHMKEEAKEREVALLEQKCLSNPTITIKDYIEQYAQKHSISTPKILYMKRISIRQN